jgi:FkbM family methyltransferase
MNVMDRLTLLNAYLSPSRDFPFPAPKVLSGIVKPPCTTIGPRYVEELTECPDYVMVRVKGVRHPLAWPTELPLFDLYKVVTEAFYERDWHFYEVPETTVRPGDSVLDCGAAEGIFSLRVVDRAASVTAFEPLPLFVQSMRRTFADSPHVTVRPEALGSKPGSGRLSGGSLYGRLSDDGDGIEVPVNTIDAWADESGARVDFIKGDLESHELEVLRGGVRTIERCRPRIAITVYHPGNAWRELLDLVRSVAPGYRHRLKGLSFNGGHSRPVMLHLWHP